MDAGQLFAQLRKELHGVARDLYLYYLYLVGLHVSQLEGEKIEDKKIIECKNHQMIKESYVKIMSLYGEFLKLEFLINEARYNKKPL